MSITSISLSYLFLSISIISIAFYLYFKLLVTKTSSDSTTRKEIIGKMKDPDSWRHRNKNMSYVSLFWAVVSLAIFIWLKYFYTAGLVPIMYTFIYLALIAVSIAVFSRVKNRSL